MAVQLSVAARNARLDAIETTVGTTPKLQIRTGTAPADCAAADAGTLLAEMDLPSDWLGNAASGSKNIAGSWSVAAAATGVAGHFRVKNAAGSVCHLQGSVSAPGGGGDMEIDNTSIASGQTVSVATFTLTDANA